jgi:inner membrane protein
MPTVLTHAAVGVGLAVTTGQADSPLCLGLSIALATAPDLDTLGLPLGVPYESFFGHRGFCHSLCCALLVALPVSLAFSGPLAVPWWLLWAYFFAVMASHGLLDGFNDGAEGIAYFSPFNNTRYLFPWRPIPAAYIDRQFIGPEMFQVLRSEILWIWLPLAVVVGCGLVWRFAL